MTVSESFSRPVRRLPARVIGGLLSVAALSVAGGGASAADLLTTKAKDAYMRACTAQGEGFFYLPGTDTCIRVGGYAWAEGYFNTYTAYPGGNDKYYTIATAGVILDARTETEYGTLRSYMETRFKWRSGDPWSNGPFQWPPTGEPPSSELEVWNIYVQFAGFTAGHAQSFFDFYANANVLGTDPATIGDDTRINLIAYTHEFAKGLSATISLEDAYGRNSGVLTTNPKAVLFEDYQAGTHAPDIVANIKYEGTWGSAQLSGALHRSAALSTVIPVTVETSTWGYALQAGIMFNLPALGEGDTLYLQTAYASGATSYLGLLDATGEYSPPDAFFNPFGMSKVSGWNFTASLLHNWNEKWSSALFGGYASYDYNDPAAQVFYGSTGGTNLNLGGYIAFTPVKHLSIALQYDYNRNEATNFVPAALGPMLPSVNASQVLLMVARDF